VGFTSGRSTSAATPDFVKALRDALGAIYGLVNNAGIGHERPPAATHDLDIEVLVRPQLLPPVVLTKSIVRHMLADG